MQIQQWAEQIKACEQSGKSVRQWCNENGVAIKTYYNHKKRVYEEMLETQEAKSTLQVIETRVMNMDGGDKESQTEPIFTELQIPRPRYQTAITVRMGGVAVDIQNGADNEVINHVLRLVSQL